MIDNVNKTLHLSRLTAACTDFDFGGTEQLAVEGIAVGNDRGDVIAWLVRILGPDRFVLLRPESVAHLDLDSFYSMMTERVFKLFLDSQYPTEPIFECLGAVGRGVLGGAAEIIEHRQEGKDSIGSGQLEKATSFTLDPLTVIIKISRGPLPARLQLSYALFKVICFITARIVKIGRASCRERV